MFDDVGEKDWFKPYVDYAVEKGLMKGTAERSFAPNAPMTRSMLVTVLWRMAGEPGADETASPFGDLTQDWYRLPVAWAYENGVVNGTSDTAFSPDAPVTREQLAAILYRYTAFKDGDVTDRADISTFPDSDVASDWALDALSWAVGTGLISGTQVEGETHLDPGGNASRAQVATVLMRYCG